ncbi:unnamed protein product, partial [Prorocentrum cordatum]
PQARRGAAARPRRPTSLGPSPSTPRATARSCRGRASWTPQRRCTPSRGTTTPAAPRAP